jgi:hypothetical protein
VRKLSPIGAMAIALIIISWSPPSVAQVGCNDIEFTSDITNRFPNARAACIDIVEHDGRPYAHFKARIMNVRGGTVEAQFIAPDGRTSRTIAFTPPADARVRIQNRTYRYSDLSPGQELDVYLPSDRWALAVAPEPVDFAMAQTVQPVPITEPSPQMAALPATAGSLPWLALLGTLAIALGGGLVALRTGRRSAL